MEQLKQKMENLVASFQTRAADLEDRLRTVSKMVQEGTPPSDAQIEQLNGQLRALSDEYRAARELADDLLPEGRALPEGASITAYREQVERYLHMRTELEQQLAGMRETLERFVRVTSRSETYLESLRPFQSSAGELLRSISGGDAGEIPPGAKEEIGHQELFLRLLSLEDMGSAEADAMLDQLDGVYPTKVQLGLSRKKYFIPDIAESPADQPDAPRAESPSILAPSIKEGSQPPASDPPSSVRPGPGEGRTRAEEQPDRCAAATKLKNLAPSASNFKRELINMNRISRAILPMLTNLGLLTANQILRFGRMIGNSGGGLDADGVNSSITHLVSKNCIAGYSVDGGEMAYCLTAYAAGSMRKGSLAAQLNRIFPIRRGNFVLTAAAEMPAAKLRGILAQNELLLAYLESVKAGRTREEFLPVRSTFRWSGDRYLVQLPGHPEAGELWLWGGEGETPSCPDGPAVLYAAAETPPALSGQRVGPCYCSNGRAVYRWEGDAWRLLDGPGDGDGLPPQEEGPSPEPPEEVPAPPAPEDPRPGPAGEDAPPTAQVPPESAPAVSEAPPPPAAAMDPAEQARALLDAARDGTPPAEDALLEEIQSLVRAASRSKNEEQSYRRLAEAVVLAKSARDGSACARVRQLYRKLNAAIGLFPRAEQDRSGEELTLLFGEDRSELAESTKLSAYMYALLSPSNPYDYTLHAEASSIFNRYEDEFPHFPQAKPLFHKLLEIQDVSPCGFTDAVISYLGGEDERERRGRELRERARELLEEPSVNARVHGLPDLTKACFGPKSDLHFCLHTIAEGGEDPDSRSLVSDTLQKYCREGGVPYVIHKEKVQELVDREWSEATKGKNTSRLLLKYDARKKIVNSLTDRLELIKAWLELTEATVREDSLKLSSLKDELCDILRKVTKEVRSGECGDYGSVVLCLLGRMYRRLNGGMQEKAPFACLLSSGYLSLDEKGLPVLDYDGQPGEIRFFEPWRNVLLHIAEPERTLEEALDAISDPQSHMYDNLGQYNAIRRLLNQTEHALSQEDLTEAKRAAEDYSINFHNELEMAYAYNRINENEKETICALMSSCKDRFFALGDYGSWRRFVNALRMQAEGMAARHQTRLRRELESRMNGQGGEVCALLMEAKRLLEEDKNFAVTEEYLNRFDIGETTLPDSVRGGGESYYQRFVDPQTFAGIYDLCRRHSGSSLRNFGWDYVSGRFPDWTARQQESARRFLSKWPSGKGALTENDFKAFFECMGLEVKGAKQVDASSVERFQLAVVPAQSRLADYRHPIAAFGTQMGSSLDVVCMYGNFTAKDLVDRICAINLSSIAVVLVNHPMDLAMRRQISQIVHTEKNMGQEPFLIIDQALMLYLTALQETERLPAMLQCTLPYTIYQPFTYDSGYTPDEMFCGRVAELSKITNFNGACVVYGGRQLGKTALLKRAESLQMVPEKKCYAVYVSIQDCVSEELFTSKIIRRINEAAGLGLKKVSTIDGLCQELRTRFRSGQVQKFLLLLDETDNFLTSISQDGYRALQPLVDFRRESRNFFKFVLAGLHNVCRAEKATAGNGIFGQLGTPLCVRPLSPADALKLLTRPLEFLGFQIKPDLHMETILTNTNYYPGILQFFGYTLVEKLSTEYGRYYRAEDGNPPYTLSDEQLGAIMNSANLNKSIREKIRLTLDLDPRYFMLARCIAMLYYYNQEELTGSRNGYTIREIRELAESYSVHCLAGESENAYRLLLDELVEMNILSRPVDTVTSYRFRRHSFLNVVGADFEAIEEELLRSNEEVAP